MRLAILADPLEHFKIYKDSTFAMMQEAASRGHEVHTFELQDLAYESGQVAARIQRIHLTGDKVKWYEAETPRSEPLHHFDSILIRKDPPFDMEYIYATYLLEQAERAGAKIWNRPRAIRDHSEKCAIMEFSAYTEATLVTRNMEKLQDFITTHHDTVLKPLDGMGGSSIFRVRQDDPNRNVIVEVLTQYGQRTIMAQRYIPAIKDGDKRVLLIAGQPVPYALSRIPMAGETRGNLAAGGTAQSQLLQAEDHRIITGLADVLWQRGLFLVGLDIIGDYLTEINVTSPTCFQEIYNQTGYNVAAQFIDALERNA